MNKSFDHKYAGIRNLRELQYQRRLVSSKLEHQEVMISYKIRSIREYISPSRLIYSGLEFLAQRNSFANNILRTYNLIRYFVQGKKK